MIWIKRFLTMIQFLTRIPVKANFNLDNRDYGKGLVFAPIVGGIIGLILFGVFHLSSYVFNQEISSLVVVVFYIFITGGLHIDGLGDTFDGVFSNRSKEKILEIMRDSRVGTNGVLAILIVFVANIMLIKNIPSDYVGMAILLMPVAGRIGSLVGAGISNYARKGEGMGKSFVDFCNTKEVIIGYLMSIAVLSFVLTKDLLPLAILPLISAIIITKVLSKTVNGVTGDILGAICELNQTTFLLGTLIFLKILI